MDPRLLSNQVFQTPQEPNLPQSIFGNAGEILFSNGLSGLDYIDNLPEDLRYALEHNQHITGTNLFAQLNNLFKYVEGGPWFIDSFNGVLYIHNEDFEDEPVKIYTYQDENGEVLSARFSLQSKYTGSTSGNPTSRADRLDPNNPYDDTLAKAQAEAKQQIGQMENPPEQPQVGMKLQGIVGRDTTSDKNLGHQSIRQAKMERMENHFQFVKDREKSQNLRVAAKRRGFWGSNGEYGDIPDTDTQIAIRDHGGRTYATLNAQQASQKDPNYMGRLFEKVYGQSSEGYLEYLKKKDYILGRIREGATYNQIKQELNQKWKVTKVRTTQGNNIYGQGIVTSNVVDIDANGIDANNVQSSISQRFGKGSYITKVVPIYGTVTRGTYSGSANVPYITTERKIIKYRVYYNSLNGTKSNVTTTNDIALDSCWYSSEGQAFISMQNQINQMQGTLNVLMNSLNKRREMELTCTLKVVGRPSLTNYMNIELWNVGTEWSGIWYIKTCTHHLSSDQGYITTLEMVRR